MKKTILVIMLLIISVLCLPNTVFAHGGKTDGAGGHYDHHTGEYHYHHGYPAHSHTNGICPYAFDDKTDHNNKYNSNYFYNDKYIASEKEVNLSSSIWSIVSQIIITILESIVIFFIGCFLLMLICDFIPNTSDKVLIIFAIIIGILSIILATIIDIF